jgi:hypothetical protein
MDSYQTLLSRFQQAILTRNPATAKDIAIARQGFDGQAQMQAYINSYYLRLEQTALNDYPATCHRMGESLFRPIVRSYVLENPSKHYSINGYGRGFAPYLHARSHDRSVWDIADYEAAISHAFHTPHSPALQRQHLANGDCVLTLHPTVTLLTLQHDMVKYRQAMDAEPKQAEQKLIVVRQQNQVMHYPLDNVEYALLKQFSTSIALDEAIEALPDTMLDTVSANLQHWLEVWIEREYFAAP